MTRQPSLFDHTALPVHRPLSRRTDPATSRAAAATVADSLPKLQGQVLEAFRELGRMTAPMCEGLDRFADYAPSTIRKRISELASAGLLVPRGTDRSRRAPCTVYGVAR